MDKKVNLKDGTEVHIREITPDDIDRSYAFFLDLPEEDRAYLRVDVTDRDIVEMRIRHADAERVTRLVAVVGDRIVADGALELEAPGWKHQPAELRMIVAHDYQRRGLGMLMARELFFLATRRQIDEIIARYLAPQKAARRILHKLGFKKEAVLRDHAIDLNGRKQDMIIMHCNIEALWRKLETYMHGSDWQRTR